jgi:hypothetical protein
MGFYDYRCMITRVSLLGVEAALFVLRRSGDRFVPVSLPLLGSYDRLGAVDAIHDDFTSRRLPGAFNELLRSGALIIDWKRIHEAPEPLQNAEAVAHLLDRNHVHGGTAITCEGAQISYALVSAHVTRGLFSTAASRSLLPHGSISGVVSELEPARTLYAASSATLIGFESVVGLLGMNAWLLEQGLLWEPPRDFGQHGDEEVHQYLAEASERFHGDMTIQAALRGYANDTGAGLPDK